MRGWSGLWIFLGVLVGGVGGAAGSQEPAYQEDLAVARVEELARRAEEIMSAAAADAEVILRQWAHIRRLRLTSGRAGRG